ALEQLHLEVTEGTLIEDADKACEVIKQLKEYGVKTHLDDFGTGYSSLNYLHQYDFDTLKISHDFTARLGSDPKVKSIIRAIVLLAEGIGLNVVTEGVETREQLEILQELNCDYCQGYYFSKPLDEDSLIQFMNEKFKTR